MRRVSDYIIDAVRRPREQLTRGQHNVRYTWDLGVHCWRQLLRHRTEGMAAELTYRTIFSLIPVVVLGLVMFRVVGGLDEVQQNVENQLYSFFGVPDELPDSYLGAEALAEMERETTESDNDEANNAGNDGLAQDETQDIEADPAQESVASEPDPPLLIPPVGIPSAEDPNLQDAVAAAEVDDTKKEDAAEDAAKDAAKQREAQRREARASIRRTLHEATSKVASIDFASIGVFGLLLFIYAAVALADSTEYLFNRIYDAPKHRPIHIRLAIHWSIITLGSGLLAMSLYMSGQFVDWAGTVGAGSTSQMVLTRFLSVGASWVLLFLLYALMPNTHVSPKAAAAGAFVGSLLWEGAKFGFQIYVIKLVPYSALYGSLGLIPLFLFWIYVTWLIVLFGLILTYTLQTLRGRRLLRGQYGSEDLLQGDPDWMLPIMSEVAFAFKEGRTIDHQELADLLGLPGRIVHAMAGRLVEGGMLRRVTTGAGEEESLTLAKPAEKIGVTDILTLAHQSRPTSSHPAWKTLAGLKQAERDAANSKTLAEIT